MDFNPCKWFDQNSDNRLKYWNSINHHHHQSRQFISKVLSGVLSKLVFFWAHLHTHIKKHLVCWVVFFCLFILLQWQFTKVTNTNWLWSQLKVLALVHFGFYNVDVILESHFLYGWYGDPLACTVAPGIKSSLLCFCVEFLMFSLCFVQLGLGKEVMRQTHCAREPEMTACGLWIHHKVRFEPAGPAG